MNKLKELELKQDNIEKEMDNLIKIEDIILQIFRLAYEIENCNMTSYNIKKAEKLYNKFRVRDFIHNLSMQDVFRDSLFEGVLRRRDEIDKQIELEKQRGENEG